MAGQSNFQDVVQLNNATLSVLGEQIQLGSDAGSKSIVFAQDPQALSAIYLAASNATGQETVVIPDANGTIGLITAMSAGTTLASNGQVVLSNSNNVSFGFNGNTLTASAGTGTAIVGIAAGTQTATSGTVIFSNSNGISFGMSGSLTITATADYVRSVSAGTTNATGNQIVFSNSNNVSFGANGATITASASFSATVKSISVYSQWAEFGTNAAITDGFMLIQKVSVGAPISVTQAALMMAMTLQGGTSNNSSGAITISMGVYSINHSTASLASSGSRQISWTSGGNTAVSSQVAGVSGTRYRTIPINLNLTQGDYLLAYYFHTTNVGNWVVMGRQAVNVVGTYDGIETSNYLDGFSTSSFTTALPSSIVVTDTGYVRTGLSALRNPGVIFFGSY